MLTQGFLTAAEHDAAIIEPVEAVWRPPPQRADTAVQAALPTLARLAQQGAGGRIQTTIDSATQLIAATAAREYLEQQADHISEIAVIVIDIASAKGFASVSLSRSGAGDLDLTQRPRSTGSVIKPMIYAAAFDAGISSPDALLDDSPASWSGYAPANYDTEFRGRITAAAALAESRNIPALRLLSQVGVQRAAGVCGAMGLQTIGRTPQRYGLSLAVGGAEATCAEVAEAYATLARDGVRRPVVWLASKGPGDHAVGPASLSPRACRATLACLSDARRTAAVCPEAAALEVAWKTGTSSGHRDAWCAAVGPARVVVVWMGNAAGEGSRSLVGGESAAPHAYSAANIGLCYAFAASCDGDTRRENPHHRYALGSIPDHPRSRHKRRATACPPAGARLRRAQPRQSALLVHRRPAGGHSQPGRPAVVAAHRRRARGARRERFGSLGASHHPRPVTDCGKSSTPLWQSR